MKNIVAAIIAVTGVVLVATIYTQIYDSLCELHRSMADVVRTIAQVSHVNSTSRESEPPRQPELVETRELITRAETVESQHELIPTLQEILDSMKELVGKMQVLQSQYNSYVARAAGTTLEEARRQKSHTDVVAVQEFVDAWDVSRDSARVVMCLQRPDEVIAKYGPPNQIEEVAQYNRWRYLLQKRALDVFIDFQGWRVAVVEVNPLRSN